MAIKAIIDKLDDAPEPLREHYAEQDGKFVLSVEPIGGFALEDVSGLKSALGKERTQRENLEKQVVAFKDIDPTKAREALARLEELGNLDPAKEADKIANTKFEAAKARLLERHGQELTQRDERIGKLTGAMDKLVRQAAATQAIAEAKGSVELLLPHVLASTRVKESEDGSFAVEVIDAAGNVRIANGKGDPMDLKALVAEMRGSETFARAFDGDGQSGSGKTADHGQGGRSLKGNMGGTREERVAALKARMGG
jgi:hypothetical protein